METKEAADAALKCDEMLGVAAENDHPWIGADGPSVAMLMLHGASFGVAPSMVHKILISSKGKKHEILRCVLIIL